MLKKQVIAFKREAIDRDAIAVIKKLNRHGFIAYLVGGSVRDLLLNRVPKDFDIITDATPEQIKEHFSRARIIGRRFRLVHILFAKKYLEVSTFRACKNKLRLYGSIEEDVLQRDFRINALYYDISKQVVLDYLGGLADIRHKRMRMIGDEETRYREDPVRLLRAIRFSVQCCCVMTKAQKETIKKSAYLLREISSARLYEECVKLFHNGSAINIFMQLDAYWLLPYLFPNIKADAFILLFLKNTQQRFQDGLSLSRAFFIAVFLWQSLQKELDKHRYFKKPSRALFMQSAKTVLASQLQITSFAKYITQQIIDIWYLQDELEQITKKHTFTILTHHRFRAAYDFLLLRSQSIDLELVAVQQFWQRQQTQAIV